MDLALIISPIETAAAARGSNSLLHGVGEGQGQIPKQYRGSLRVRIPEGRQQEFGGPSSAEPYFANGQRYPQQAGSLILPKSKRYREEAGQRQRTETTAASVAKVTGGHVTDALGVTVSFNSLEVLESKKNVRNGVAVSGRRADRKGSTDSGLTSADVVSATDTTLAADACKENAEASISASSGSSMSFGGDGDDDGDDSFNDEKEMPLLVSRSVAKTEEIKVDANCRKSATAERAPGRCLQQHGVVVSPSSRACDACIRVVLL